MLPGIIEFTRGRRNTRSIAKMLFGS